MPKTLNVLLICVVSSGCVSWTQKRTGVAFAVTPSQTDGCAWVQRHNFEKEYTEGYLSDAQGQVYLYHCCPSEQGSAPTCVAPRWGVATNDKPIPQPASAPAPPPVSTPSLEAVAARAKAYPKGPDGAPVAPDTKAHAAARAYVEDTVGVGGKTNLEALTHLVSKVAGTPEEILDAVAYGVALHRHLVPPAP